MPKNTSMTRERKIAMPVILQAAQNYMRMLNGEMPPVAANTRARLDQALAAFDARV